MRKFRKPLSLILALMLALSVFGVCASASAAEVQDAQGAGHSGQITFTSNVADSVVAEYETYNNEVTVTYQLQSPHSIVNTQAYVQYDPAVLELADVDAETNLPILDKGSVVFNTGISGYVYINASKINFYNFKNPKVYYTQTFRIIGSGDTTVNFNMEVLTGSDQTDYNQATSDNDITLVDFSEVSSNDFTFSIGAELSGEAPLPDGYYLAGVRGWEYSDLTEEDKFEPSGSEYTLDTTLVNGDSIKVAKVENGEITTWYPDGTDDEFTVDAEYDGDVTIRFSPVYNAEWAKFGGYFCVPGKEVPTEAPTTYVVTEPATEEPTEPATEEPTVPATEEPTQPATEKPTEPATEAVDRDGVLVVADDFTLQLNTAGKTTVTGEIYLAPGQYKFRMQKDRTLMGYGATINDVTTKGLTYNAKFKAQTTLNAQGGVYKFQFSTTANALVVTKVDSSAPAACLTGDLHTILKPVPGNETVVVGSMYIAPGEYKFKVMNGSSECGYNKVINDTTGNGMLSVNPKYKADMTLNATGGMYTFKLFTKTNKFSVAYVNDSAESKTDVHVAGDINLVLSDNDGADEVATGSVTLDAGTYSFKIYNYGVVYTIGGTIRDTATKNLKSSYTTPVTLNATGGTYTFDFNKNTGVLTVTKA